MIGNPPETGININVISLVYISKEWRAWCWAAQWASRSPFPDYPPTLSLPASTPLLWSTLWQNSMNKSWVVCLQFLAFCSPVSPLQSGFCFSHSTEMSLVKIYDARVRGFFWVPSLLDLLVNQSGSPTCSTMSLQRHCSLSWFSFYLTDHFFLHLFACSSSPRPLFLSILNSLVILSSLKALNSN